MVPGRVVTADLETRYSPSTDLAPGKSPAALRFRSESSRAHFRRCSVAPPVCPLPDKRAGARPMYRGRGPSPHRAPRASAPAVSSRAAPAPGRPAPDTGRRKARAETLRNRESSSARWKR